MAATISSRRLLSFAPFAVNSSSRKHVLGRLLGRREGAGFREGDGSLERARNLALHRHQARLVEVALLLQLVHEARDRVSALPRLDLDRVARVGLAAALGMGAPAIGLAF